MLVYFVWEKKVWPVAFHDMVDSASPGCAMLNIPKRVSIGITAAQGIKATVAELPGFN